MFYEVCDLQESHDNLLEALRKITGHYADLSMNHEAFRIFAADVAATAIAKATGGDNG